MRSDPSHFSPLTSYLISLHVAARDPRLRARHLVRLGAQPLRHGRGRGVVPAIRRHPAARALQVLAHPFVLGLAIIAVPDRVHRRQDPLRRQRLGRRPHLHPSSGRGLSLLQCVRRVPEDWKIGRRCSRAGVALTSHGAKATTRAAANTSPEPVSNWTLSVAEDRTRGVPRLDGGHSPDPHRRVVVVLVIVAVLVIWKLYGLDT